MEIPVQKKNQNYKTRLFQDFTLSKSDRIGKGGFGEVYKAKKKQDEKDYAIKIVKIKNKKDANLIQQEVWNLAKLDHPNIVRYYNSWIDTATVPPEFQTQMSQMTSDSEQEFFYVDEIESLQSYGYFSPTSNSSNDIDNNENESDTEINYLCIQMELCENSLDTLIMDNENSLSPAVLLDYARQICEGLKHIHEEAIIHRDLKPENIFISSKKSIKIGDFGLSKCTDNPSENKLLQEKIYRTVCGSKMYMAPEIISREYDKRVDLYSLGVIYLKMCCKAKTDSEFVGIIQRCKQNKNMYTLRQDFGISSRFKDLIPSLLNRDPNERPTCDHILSTHLQKPIDPTILQRVMSYSNPKKNQLQRKIFKLKTLGEIDLMKCEKYNLVLQTASKIFELHGGKNIPMSTFIPLGKADRNTVKVLYTDGDCPVAVSQDSRITFAQYVRQENLTSIRRYSIGNVFKNNEEFIPKQIQECSFDVVEKYLHQDSITEAEVLFTAKQIIDTLGITEANIIYHINDSLVLDSILKKDKAVFYKTLIEVSRDNLTVEEFRLKLEQMKLPTNVINNIVSLYTPQSLEQFKTVLSRNNFKNCLRNCQYLERLIQNLIEFGVKNENIFIAPLLLSPKLKYIGLNFKIYLEINSEINESKRYDIACGGRYDSIVYPKIKDCFAMGISFNVEHISQFIDDIKLLSDGCRIICRSNNKSNVIPILKFLWSHEITAYEYTDYNKEITYVGITIELCEIDVDEVTVIFKNFLGGNFVIYTGSYKSESFLETIKKFLQVIHRLKFMN